MNNLGRILLVDDDPGVLSSMNMWLSGEGYEVIPTSNSTEALIMMKKTSPHLCLVDLRLGDEDGIQLAEKLSALDSSVPIIILTAYPTYETAKIAIKTGVYDYLAKTTDNDVLLNRIRLAIDEHLEGENARVNHRNNLVLLCSHPETRVFFQTFCQDNPPLHLHRVYTSIDALSLEKDNPGEVMLLICEKCFLLHPDQSRDYLSRSRQACPQARILVINTNMFEGQLIDYFHQGVIGFLQHKISPEETKKALFAIMEGDMWITRSLSQLLLAELQQMDTLHDQSTSAADRFALTEREIEILRALSSGLSNLDISEQLFISEKTVKTHINNIYKKMGIKSRTHAVLKALEHHLVCGLFTLLAQSAIM